MRDCEKVYQCSKDATVTVKTEVTICCGEFCFRRFVSCSGFFVRKCNQLYIVTAAHCVTIRVGRRCRREPPANSPIARVERIFVHVYNAECKKSYVYEADLEGLDGAGDIAVLKIDPLKEWNKTLPSLSDQPSLKFASSRGTKIGSKVCVIGDPFGLDYQSVTIGVVRDNKHMEQTGSILVETITIDSAITCGNSGSPILNDCGRVIGMITFSSKLDDFSGGPAQKILQRVVCRIIKGKSTQVMVDVLGNFKRYIKGYMGLKYHVVSAFDMNNLLSPDGCNITNLNSFTGPVKDAKLIKGMAIEGVDGTTGCQNNSGTNSPFLGTIAVGDIVTDIFREFIGTLKEQINPTNKTWFLNHVSKPVTLTYRKASEYFANEHKVTAFLATFPESRDRSYRFYVNCSMYLLNGILYTALGAIQKLKDLTNNVEDEIEDNSLNNNYI